MCTGLGREHMCRREINSLIWGFLFVSMINTAPVTREILSVQLQAASLVANSRFGSVSCTSLALKSGGFGMMERKFSWCHLRDWKAAGPGRFHRPRKVCGHSAESRTVIRQRLGGLGALIAEETLLGKCRDRQLWNWLLRVYSWP